VLSLAVVGFLIGYSPQSFSEIFSLRGATDLDEMSNEVINKRWQSDREPMSRDYVQQPPMVPHTINGYTINRNFNKCLTCHSWANYRKAAATKVSQTHFEDRDGGVLANISARRYFCTQCHVPQVDTKPLVENTFEPLFSVKHKDR
jgi:cytochrome c-type protein NapB